jgi:CheY-like chemotaxis protein
MHSDDQQPDALLIANRIKELLLEHGVGKRQHANEVSRILGLSFSQAHRKLKGQSPWAINQVRDIALAFDASPSALLDTMDGADAPARMRICQAVLSIGRERIPCTVHLGAELSGGQRADFIALERDGEWQIHRGDGAPPGRHYLAETIEIRSTCSEVHKMSIAVLDDAVETADELSTYLLAHGFNASPFHDVPSFLDALRTQAFDGFLIDWLIGQETAGRCIEEIRASENPDAPVLILTGYLDLKERESEIATAMRDFDVLGPYEKPVKLSVIKAALERCFNL